MSQQGTLTQDCAKRCGEKVCTVLEPGMTVPAPRDCDICEVDARSLANKQSAELAYANAVANFYMLLFHGIDTPYLDECARQADDAFPAAFPHLPPESRFVSYRDLLAEQRAKKALA